MDSHAHLNDSRLIDRLSEILELCATRKVNHINVVGYDSESNLRALDVVRAWSSNPWGVRLYLSLGFHPTPVLRDDLEKSFEEFRSLLLSHRQQTAFVGEVGLDYYWVKDSELRARQRTLRLEIFELAERVHRPLMIHCRNAWKDMIAFLREHPPAVPVVFHSYSGSKGDTRNLLALDIESYYSIPTSILRNRSYINVVKLIPIERLLAETDSPYLSPVKGELNIPCNVVKVYEFLAAQLGLRLEELAERILENYLALVRASRS